MLNKLNKRNKLIVGGCLLSFLGVLVFQSNLPSSLKNLISNTYQNASVYLPEAVKDSIVPQAPKTVVLLGSAEISYEGSTTGRGKNIELGVARFDGKVIMPGEEFSFIKSLGSVSKAQGFSEEKSFKNGEVSKGLGGGLCQVSTTLFQSVLSAGLPVTERHNHTFAVPFYKVGLDATYANPRPDFKFVNDTGYEITIKGRTENNSAIFEIYGVSDGRTSSLSEAEIYNQTKLPQTKYIKTFNLPTGTQKCENTSQKGYSAKVNYNVSYPSGENKEQVFTSIYQPLARICYVGMASTEKIGCTDTTIYSPVTGAKCQTW